MWSRAQAQSVGGRVSDARRSSGLTQAQVVERVEALGLPLTPATLSRLERGEASSLVYENQALLRAIARATDADEAWLVEGVSVATAPAAASPDESADLRTASARWRPAPGEHVRIWLQSPGHCAEGLHAIEEEGRTGDVVTEAPPDDIPSHPFLVLFHEPLRCLLADGRTVELRARHYAPQELRPA